MKRWYSALMLFITGVMGLTSWASGQENSPRYWIEMKDRQKVVGTLTYDLSCKNLKASEWVVFVTQAPELPSQTDVKTALFPTSEMVADQSPLRRSVLKARVPVTSPALVTEVPIKVVYEATLRSRELKLAPAGAKLGKVPGLSDNQRQAYLADLGDVDHQGAAFQKWLQGKELIRRPKEGDIGLARRVFLSLKSSLVYEYKSGMDRLASAVCQGGRSDCGGMSHVFVAAMRANAIPARTLYGRWAQSAKVNEKLGQIDYFQWHVKAEFFADGIGWVPVDVSAAVVHDKTREGLQYFGVDRGEFLTFHIDPNFVINTGPFGAKAVHNLQVPAWWVAGSGSVSPSVIREGWTVKKTAVANP